MLNLKQNFPIFKNNPNLVYLDSAATSQKPQIVLDAVSDFYTTYNANIHRGIYPIAERATAAVEDVRKKVARFINANDPSEIIFTKGTTEGVNLVMYTWGRTNVKKDDVIMTTIMEHHANFVPWQMLAAEKNALFDVVDITDDGLLEEDQLITDAASAKFLAVSSVSNMLGTVVDVEDIILRVRQNAESRSDSHVRRGSRLSLSRVEPRDSNNKRGPIILVDAAQHAQHRKIDVQKMDCDFLVFSGHKMFAETGIGVLYARKGTLDEVPLFLFGGDMIRVVTKEKTTFADMPSKFEGGTQNISGIISLGAAIDFIEDIGFEKIQEHEQKLMAYGLERMANIDGLTVYGPKDTKDRSGVISFTIDGMHPHDLAQILGDASICIRSGHHCTMPLHTRLGIQASARASFSLYNTKEDIDHLVEGIQHARHILQ